MLSLVSDNREYNQGYASKDQFGDYNTPHQIHLKK